jgi:hypothetical protein
VKLFRIAEKRKFDKVDHAILVHDRAAGNQK